MSVSLAEFAEQQTAAVERVARQLANLEVVQQTMAHTDGRIERLLARQLPYFRAVSANEIKREMVLPGSFREAMGL